MLGQFRICGRGRRVGVEECGEVRVVGGYSRRESGRRSRRGVGTGDSGGGVFWWSGVACEKSEATCGLSGGRRIVGWGGGN